MSRQTVSSEPTHITIVCCHSIWIGDGANGKDAGLADDEWLLESFQGGEGRTFRQHVIQGILNARQEGGELWFSGGPTKRPKTDLGEGESYKRLCETLIRNPPIELSKYDAQETCPKPFSIHADEIATDSLQNVIFPILQSSPGREAIREDAKKQLIDDNRPWLPFRLTIISHEFKRERFMSLHLPALGFGSKFISDHVRYVGIDPEADEEKRQQFFAGENKALAVWRTEWTDDGLCAASTLGEKRLKRGWDDKESRLRLQQILCNDEILREAGIDSSVFDRLSHDKRWKLWGVTFRCDR